VRSAAEELRLAEGAFPALGGAPGAVPGGAPKGGGGVLSLMGRRNGLGSRRIV
jgi:hypothetical protein